MGSILVQDPSSIQVSSKSVFLYNLADKPTNPQMDMGKT